MKKNNNQCLKRLISVVLSIIMVFSNMAGVFFGEEKKIQAATYGTINSNEVKESDSDNSDNKRVVIHFKNTCNWENVGVWLYQGIGWTKNVCPKEECPAYNTITDKPLWPGAKMVKEENYEGWYSITAYFDDRSKGAIMIFNNLVADTKVDTSVGGDVTDQQFVEESGLIMNSDLKESAPNQLIVPSKFTEREYWCDFDGNLYGKAGQLTSDKPDSYVNQNEYDKDTEKPTGKIEVSKDISDIQTATLTMVDNVAVEGYYWGTDKIYENNKYVSTTSEKVTKELKDSGTYYLTVKDTSGNVSDTYSVTLYKIILDANGGNASVAAVLVTGGEVFEFPIATRTGYEYNGWSEVSTDTTGVSNFVPTKNTVYYAIWKAVSGYDFTVANLTYRFSNSHKGFNYSYDYQIPYSSYKLIYGDTVRAKYLYRQNKGVWGGNCFGMASTSGMFNQVTSGVNVGQFNANAVRVSDLNITDRNGEGITVCQMIEGMQVSQFDTAIGKTINKHWGNLSELTKTVDAVKTNGKPVMITVYGPEGGHALLGYEIKKVSSTKSYLYVYDCNYPNKDRYITLSTTSNGKVTGWYYYLNDIYNWGSSYSGCGISYVDYDTYSDEWKNRAKDNTENMLYTNSRKVAIYDYSDKLVATINDNKLNTTSEDIYLVKEIGITVDNNTTENKTLIMLPSDMYTIKNCDSSIGEFEVNMVHNERGATVSTTSDEVILAVNDDSEMNLASINTDINDTYDIVLDSTSETDNSQVEVSGISDGSVVSTSQLKGNITINNCAGAAIYVNGENIAESGGNKNITNADIDIEDATQVYDGNAKQPVVLVTANGKKLEKGKDYVAVYTNNINAGNAEITIYGIGEYTGSKKITFTIFKKKIQSSDFNIDTETEKYTGKSIKKKMYSSLREGRDYKVSYKNNKNPGKATIIITGKGNYNGKINKTFIINPAKSVLTKISNMKSGKVKITWKKQSGVTGYEIQYSKDRKFSKDVKIKKVSTYYQTISKLKVKNKYYFKVRAYKNADGKIVYGAWSKVNTIAVK